MLKKINKKLLFYFTPFLLGVMTSFSLPPYDLFFLNFITFPFLFIFFFNNFNKNKWKSFTIGWIFGFGYFLSNIYWITNSLTFEEIFKILIPFALVLIPLFLGLFYGFATYIFSFINPGKNFSSILIFSLILSSIEFIRGIILGGFPWNLIAFSWTEYTNFLQILAFIGTYSFNLISITLFLVPSVIFFNINLRLKLILNILLIILIGTNFYYGKKVKNNYNNKENITLNTNIKIISPNIELDRFFQNEDTSIIINELIELSKPGKDNEILIFPEGILANILLEDLHIYREKFKNNFSKNHKILLGINSYENSKIFNSLVVFENDLSILAKYNKNKLVPFGEFLPFENIFSKIGLKKITQGYISFSSDSDRNILEINDLKFLPLICYEIIYSGNLNKKNQEFDFIINISEDGWFGESIGPYQHFSHAIFRSIEEGKDIIRSTNGGISAHINAKGEILRKIKSTDKGVIEVKSYKKNSKTFFSIHGNKIFFYFAFFYIILSFFLKKKES